MLMTIGERYDNFSQVTEDEVRALLKQAEREVIVTWNSNRRSHVEACG